MYSPAFRDKKTVTKILHSIRHFEGCLLNITLTALEHSLLWNLHHMGHPGRLDDKRKARSKCRKVYLRLH